MEQTQNYIKHTSKNPLKKFFINNFFRVLFFQIKDLKIESILDVGCGEGITLSKLKENKILRQSSGQVGRRLEGIDYSKEAVEIANKNYPNLHILEGDIYKLKYKDNSFDLVICSEVLEHLEDPQKALRELARVSRRYILLSVPNEPWFYLFNYTQWGKDIGHINKWSRNKFIKFINLEGYKVISVKTPFPWTTVLVEKN
jgi:2-polyprenyl-3-methyl-5-hydroxy-6-metoxy-1,4-benzoquinol methylase